MISGIGVDIVKISRIVKLANHDKRLNRMFTIAEHEYCQSKAYPEQHYAGFWAAKEAYVKASGEIHRPFNDFEIIHRGNKPYFNFIEKTPLNNLTTNRFHLSISHEKKYAIAMVVIDDIGRQL